MHYSPLIFVLGAPRSGTTALLNALGQDARVRTENEAFDNPFYTTDSRLRSEQELRPMLSASQRPVLLKPILDLLTRSLDELLIEFERYQPKVAWIFRDPQETWRSSVDFLRWPVDDQSTFIDQWTGVNNHVLESRHGRFGSDIAVVDYADVSSSPELLMRLGRLLGLQPSGSLIIASDRLKQSTTQLKPTDEERERLARTFQELRQVRMKPPRAWCFTNLSSATDASTADSDDGGVVTLRTHHGASAQITRHAGQRSHLRVSVTDLPVPWIGAVQLQSTEFDVAAGRGFRVNICARSAQPVMIGVGVGTAFIPERPLLHYQDVHLGQEWTRASFSCRSVSYEPISLRVFLGAEPAEIDISELDVQLLGESPATIQTSSRSSSEISYPARVHILEAGDNPSDLLFIEPLQPIHEGVWYELRFGLKSDERRTVGIAVRDSLHPEKCIFQRRSIDVFPEEVQHAVRLTVDADLPQPEFIIELGGSSITVEAWGISIQPIDSPPPGDTFPSCEMEDCHAPPRAAI